MSDVLAWLRTVHWLPVAIAAISWLTSLTNDWSKFPIEVDNRWKPVVVLVLGQVYAVLLAIAAGVPWRQAAWEGVATSFVTMGMFDTVSKAAWGDDPPPWARALQRLFRALSFAKKEPAKPADSPPPA